MDNPAKSQTPQHPGGSRKWTLPGFRLDLIVAPLLFAIQVFVSDWQITFLTWITSLPLKREQIVKLLGRVSLVVAGILIFALFIHDPWPRRIIALGGLLISASIMGFTLRQDSLQHVFGIGKPNLKISLFTLAGLLLGGALGIFTRQHFKLSLLPSALTLIAFIAPLTGAMEELVFRGYIQGKLNPVNRIFALVYAAIAHTAYKLLVIYSLGRPHEFDFLFLAQWTLLGGLAFGGLRLLSKSIYPPLLAHLVFDILLYGGLLLVPFWVWA
jgi:membrane protease YdiL (CAAX protease family)